MKKVILPCAIVVILVSASLAYHFLTTTPSARPRQADYPIYLYVMVHVDQLGTYGFPQPVPENEYLKERSNLEWLTDYTVTVASSQGADYQPRLALEFAGDQAQKYLEDPTGLDYLREIHASGVHTFGTHCHRQYRIEDNLWVNVGEADRENWVMVTQQHIDLVDQLVGAVLETTDNTQIRAANAYGSGHMWDFTTAWNAGIKWEVGGGGEPLNIFFDHEAYNPWRMGGTEGFTTDYTKGDFPPVIRMPIPTVLGQIGRHMPHPFLRSTSVVPGATWIWQDQSVPAAKRKFLFLYLEWLYRVRKNLPAKVWLFGFTEHTNNLYSNDGAYGNTRNLRDEVEEFVTWLNQNFIQSKTPEGYTIARWAQPAEVASAFERWEAENPTASSFSFPYSEIPWDGTTDSNEWELYPYELNGLAKELMYSHHVEEVTGFPGARVHKLLRVEVTTSPNTVPTDSGQIPWRYLGGQAVPMPGLATRTIYVVWREAASGTVEISTRQLLGTDSAVVIDGDTALSATYTGAVPVGETPVVIYAP